MEMPSVQSRLFAGRNRAALFSAAKILLIFLFFIMVRERLEIHFILFLLNASCFQAGTMMADAARNQEAERIRRNIMILWPCLSDAGSRTKSQN